MSKGPVREYNAIKTEVTITPEQAVKILLLIGVERKDIPQRLEAIRKAAYSLYEYDIFDKENFTIYCKIKPMPVCMAADILILDSIAQEKYINNIELNQKLYEIYQKVWEEKDFNIFEDAIPEKLGSTTNWYVFLDVYHKYCIYGANDIWRPYNLWRSNYDIWKEKMGIS